MIGMNETVRLLLSLSLSGSILGLLILALKPLIKHRVPKSIQYYIWLIVLLRLVTPFSPENSLMNDVFYSSGPAGETNPAGEHNPEGVNSQTGNQSGIPSGVQTSGSTGEFPGISLTLPNIMENAARGAYNNDVDHSRYLQDLLTQYIIYLWLLGVVIAITVNLAGYTRFLNCLRQGYREATDDENSLLTALLKGRKRVRLLRNKFVPTPMLIGIWRPCIIIPDVDFDEKQLKNILLHEVTHLRRFDIQVKWLTMTAASIHWFNPLVYLFKRKINQACELACDEAVIKNLSPAEKQAYGDTLISVIAEHKYPVGVLQATMSEEKKSLQERLVAIMKHHQKSRQIIILSGILLGVFLFGAIYLGAGVGSGAASPPNLYIAAEGEKTKAALKGSYSWTNGERHIQADSDHPVNFAYSLDNTVSVSGKEQLILGTRKTKNDKQYDFTIEDLTVYKDKQPVDFAGVEPGFMNGSLYLQVPPDPGEYIYVLRLNIKDDKGKAKGTVSYGFVVRVDMMNYDLAEHPREVIDLVENNLEIIMSSPKESSNPMDYIKAHQNEYETIIKYSYSYNNEEVLKYMLSQFEEGNAEGLRGHLLMGLCKELLGERNNVMDETLTPAEWYAQLNVRQEVSLPDFSYGGTDPIEKLVYETEIEKNKTSGQGFTIIAPHIFGSYVEGNKLKVFVTTFSSSYRLYDKVLSLEGGGIIPVAITYVKNADGSYSLEDYEPAQDGAYFAGSIREFCTMPTSGKNIKGLAGEILRHYGDYEDIKKLQRENLIRHLKANGQYGVSLYQKQYQKPAGLIPLT